MADSDEEGDSRKSRDKFKRERSDYGDKYRKDASSRDDGSRRRSRDYRNEGGRSEFSPPQKRMRRDNWEGYGGQMPRMPWGPREQQPPPPPSGNTIMSFKQFLAQQDDSIEDTEAIQKYNEYKRDVKKKQLQLFFNKHKEEEWFRNKYHPVCKSQLKARSLEGYKSRSAAFSILHNHSLIKDVSLCNPMSKQITKLMDSAVILMEGGTVYDLQVLDETKKEETKSSEDAAGGGEDDTKSEEGDNKKLQKYDLEVTAAAEEKSNNEEDDSVDEEKKKTEDDTTTVDDETADPDPSDDTEKHEDDKTTDPASPASPEAPRALHLTKSAYIRHIAPNVSSADILEVCKQFSGYLRMALDGPDFEKNYELRGWVTFTADANIREVISQLCSIKNSQLTCMANRDLTRRVKQLGQDVFPYSKEVVRADIELATQLIQYLDNKHELCTEDNNNPLLKETQDALANITSNVNDGSTKQRSKEEDEDDDEEEEEGSVHDDSDEWSDEFDNLFQINDNLLWYLRIVHSVDYYSGNMVNQEHQMPHRCGIITARPPKPDIIASQPEEVMAYLESAKKKITPLMEETKLISDDEANELGKKDVDSEIEKFIADNTKEISKEKFLCPLSGKKFRGPEFVRKHIFNKHAGKLEEVKQDVEFFHNYLYDPARPMPLESELLSEEPAEGGFPQHPPDFVPWGTPHMMMFRRGMFPQRGFDMFPFRGGRMRRRGGGGFGGRGRRIVEYHDLDAPADMEF